MASTRRGSVHPSAAQPNSLSLEQLEQRALLSAVPTLPGVDPAQLGPGVEIVEWGPQRTTAASNSYILTFDRNLDARRGELLARELATRLGLRNIETRSIGAGYSAVLNTERPLTYSETQSMLRGFHRQRGPLARVVGFEPNVVYTIGRSPNDPFFSDQWHLDNTGQPIPGGPGTPGASLNLPPAWDVTIGSRSVIIAVIDSGVDVNHPDLNANIWRNPGEIPGNGIDDDGNGYVDDVFGYDFGEQDNNPANDLIGHGTAVAGVIGATGNNNRGVTGVAWDVSILPLKIADRFGNLRLEAIVAAHDYVTMMRARGFNIVASNNSYGAIAAEFYVDQDFGFVAERQAIERFLDSGGIFIAAAGNSALDNDEVFRAYPASYNLPGIISVAATDPNDALAGFSNFGAQNVDVAAPGVAILTTFVGDGYGYADGTSFAAPAVAGVVALLKTVRPDASAFEIRQALIDGSDPAPSLQGRVVSGGRVNAAKSLTLITRAGPVVRFVNPGPITTPIDSSTGVPIGQISVTFNKPIDPALLNLSNVSLRRAGPDGQLGTGDDVTIALTSINLDPADSSTVIIGINLNVLPGGRLAVDQHRLVLTAAGFKDLDGNFLNGNLVGGVDEVYNFRVVSIAADNEPNDTLATATPVNFNASGQAVFSNATIGNGIFTALDVDIYRVNMARGGQISAEVIAKRLPNSSTLDSFVRLFNAQGVELASNDNFFGQDSFVDFFVSTGGTYYIGVSGFGNASYNPAVAGSGQTQSTGIYDLRITAALTSDDRVTAASTFTEPKAIPPLGTQGTTSDSIVVADSRLILDVNVRINIEHEYTSDLRISLIGPAPAADGSLMEVILVNRRGGSGQNFTGTVLDDEAVVNIANGTAPFAGVFRPDQPLSRFDGTSAAGLWTLRIVDTTAVHSGALISWSIEFTLANDIFGPFESNDTIPTATTLQGVNGAGNASLTAFIGDGGFGARDRDIFRFVAEAGSSLNATVTSFGQLNSALRLFTEQGTQILLSSPTTSLNSSIDGYVFPEAGVYYLAVTEANNVAFNPFVVTTGEQALTTGSYQLTVNMVRGVSDTSVVLAGNTVGAAYSPGGISNVLAGGARTGLTFGGVEFLFDRGNPLAQPRAFLGLTADGSSFRNTNIGALPATELTFALTDQSDTFNRRVSSITNFRGIRLERSFSFGVGDAFIAVDLTLTNVSTEAIRDVAWFDAFNADHGLNLDVNTPLTLNDVDNALPYASARVVNNAFQQGLTIAMGAAPFGGQTDARARTTFVSPLLASNLRDARQLLDLPLNDPNGQAGDLYMAMVYDFGTINAGQTVTARYFIFFGTTPDAARAQYNQVVAGTGAGHLAANSANPALETLSRGDQVPQLPYRLFYPEGFANEKIYTFIPIYNPNDQPTRVVLIARNETGPAGLRDKVLGDVVIPGNSRGGFTLNTPDLYANDTQLVDKLTPYALELRAQRPVAATFSYYDLQLLNDFRSAIGEPFSSRVGTTWTFGKVTKAPGVFDFVLFYNTTPNPVKVTTTFLPEGGGAPISLVFNLAPFRRGGWDVTAQNAIPAGNYGVVIEAEGNIVASVSHYDSVNAAAEGYSGSTSLGSNTGLLPDGRIGLGATRETIGIVNAQFAPAQVLLSFLYANGSAYRTLVNVPARGQATIDVGSLDNFPTGQPYSVLFSSSVPVTVESLSLVFNQALASTASSQAYTLWGFGEGFRAGDGVPHPGVTEYLRLFNPTDVETTIEIRLGYDNNLGSEVFRRSLAPRQVLEIDVHTLVTGPRRAVNAWYGISVKAPTPIVAYFAHYDSAFPGAFATLGTPFGATAPLA